MKTLAENIRKRRLELALSQTELAHIVGVPQPRISELERGCVKNPRILTLLPIARALKTTVDRLFC